jgi:hypothetical protein
VPTGSKAAERSFELQRDEDIAAMERYLQPNQVDAFLAFALEWDKLARKGGSAPAEFDMPSATGGIRLGKGSEKLDWPKYSALR